MNIRSFGSTKRPVGFAAWARLNCIAVICGLGCTAPADNDRYELASSSMAPAFLGPSLSAHCRVCRNEFAVAADTYREDFPTRCYRCGANCAIGGRIRNGDRIAVRRVDSMSDIRRFDLLAFSSSDAAPLQVKRVWGLPGETVRILDGELWVNGRTLHKQLDELETVAVPVSNYPDDTVSHWWLEPSPQSNGTRQRIEDISSTEACTLPAGRAFVWRYQQPARVDPSASPRDRWLAAATINDDFMGNQGLSYQLQSVPDFLIEIEFHERLSTPAELTCQYLRREVQVLLSPGKSDVEITQTGELSIPCTQSVKLGFCDRRILVQSGNVTSMIPWLRLADRLHPAEPNQSEIRLTAKHQDVIIKSLRIARDLYLRTNSRTGDGEQEFGTVPNEAFFMLGDNQPASQDSRNGLGWVPIHKVRGKVIRSTSDSQQ